MIKWLQYLLTGALTLTLPQKATSVDRQASLARQSSMFISDHTAQWLEGLREKYEVPGFGIGIVASPARTPDDWESEVLSFGHSDHHHKHYDEDVSTLLGAQLSPFTDSIDFVPHWRQFQIIRFHVHWSASQ